MKKYIVITGASSGIGYSAAIEFAKMGKNLILIARREGRLNDLKNKISIVNPNVDVKIRSFDLAETSKLENLFSEFNAMHIETWINNAGFGMYNMVQDQDISKTNDMMRINIDALTILSILYTKKYCDTEGAQLINISSSGGYIMVPTAVTYCASKFYVGAFTEGLALELKQNGSKLRAKVLAPSATETEFGMVANNDNQYDYEKRFNKYHTSEEMAKFLIELYLSDEMVGYIDRESFKFKLSQNRFDTSMNSKNNQN